MHRLAAAGAYEYPVAGPDILKDEAFLVMELAWPSAFDFVSYFLIQLRIITTF